MSGPEVLGRNCRDHVVKRSGMARKRDSVRSNSRRSILLFAEAYGIFIIQGESRDDGKTINCAHGL